MAQVDDGTRSWSGMLPHVHALQLYDTDEFLTRIVSRFVSHALGAGAPVIVVATEPHRVDVAAALTQAGHDVAAAENSGQLRFADARATLDLFMVRGAPDRARFAEHVGGLVESMQAVHPTIPLHAFGEMVDLLARDGNHDAAIRLEELWNGLARLHRFSLLCAYGLDAFPRTADGVHLERICNEHARVVPAESYRPGDSGEARAREIVRLQQRARALEGEVARLRKLVDDRR